MQFPLPYRSVSLSRNISPPRYGHKAGGTRSDPKPTAKIHKTVVHTQSRQRGNHRRGAQVLPLRQQSGRGKFRLTSNQACKRCCLRRMAIKTSSARSARQLPGSISYDALVSCELPLERRCAVNYLELVLDRFCSKKRDATGGRNRIRPNVMWSTMQSKLRSYLGRRRSGGGSAHPHLP